MSDSSTTRDTFSESAGAASGAAPSTPTSKTATGSSNPFIRYRPCSAQRNPSGSPSAPTDARRAMP